MDMTPSLRHGCAGRAITGIFADHLVCSSRYSGAEMLSLSVQVRSPRDVCVASGEHEEPVFRPKRGSDVRSLLKYSAPFIRLSSHSDDMLKTIVHQDRCQESNRTWISHRSNGNSSIVPHRMGRGLV